MAGPEDKDTRTLPPSPKRIREFRKRGEIALSRDLTAAVTLLGAVTGLLTTLSSAGARLTHIMQAPMSQLDSDAPVAIAHETISAYYHLVVPVLIGAVGAALGSIFYQHGWPPALKAPSFDLTKPFKLGGLPGLVNPKAAAGRVVKQLAKLVFVVAAGAYAMYSGWNEVMHGPPPSAEQVSVQIVHLTRGIFIYSGGALLLLAGLDFALQKRDLMAKMRMTPQEAKREHKESEGDPYIKRKRRRKMRELAQRRLAQAVPTADVVLVNPTEYAVALRYKSDEDKAPRVVAKGRMATAERIRDIARQAGVPIIPSPPLCRLIHKLVPEGKEIPGQLFQAVAEVLAYVYRLRGRSN